jgi:hypothetical protein
MEWDPEADKVAAYGLLFFLPFGENRTKRSLPHWQAPWYKELIGFKHLASLFELLELSFRLFELFFLLENVIAQAVDLVKHDFHRGLLFPRLPGCLSRDRGRGLGGSRIRRFLC